MLRRIIWKTRHISGWAVESRPAHERKKSLRAQRANLLSVKESGIVSIICTADSPKPILEATLLSSMK